MSANPNPYAWKPNAPNFKQKGARVLQRAHRKAEKQSALDEAYAIVDARDGLTDRVTGHRLQLGGVDERTRLERHHIRPRSTHPESRHDPANILTVSALVHRLIEADIIQIEGSSASLPNTLRFHYRPGTPKEQRLVQIQSRRRSQRSEEA